MWNWRAIKFHFFSDLSLLWSFAGMRMLPRELYFSVIFLKNWKYTLYKTKKTIRPKSSVLAFKKSTSPYYSKHSKKFVALTMTNDFIDIKVIGHGRGKQPKRRDTKKGWVQIHGLDICIPHTYCSKIRKKSQFLNTYYLHFLNFTLECSRLCVCPTLTIGLVQKAPLGFQK